jgi:hypothetical protein
MAWKIRLQRGTPYAEDSASVPHPTLPTVRGHPLVVFRRLAAILDLTSEIARSSGESAHHAALAARLAILRARVESGQTSPLLAAAIAEFGREFKSFIAVHLGFGRA